MYFHLELKGQGYKAAEYGVAVSDTPTGDFKLLYAGRSCPGVYPLNMTQEQIEQAKTTPIANGWEARRNSVRKGAIWARDFETGQMARDMTLFVDDDDKAYHIFSSEDNQTLHIVELTDDYLRHSDRYVRILAGDANEAPAILKRDGVYWLFSSGCTGWDPNAARLSRATDIMGEWERLDNPCVGDNAEKTFYTQSTYVINVEGSDVAIFMADRWTPDYPINGRYILLPIEFENDKPIIKWYNEWKLN